MANVELPQIGINNTQIDEAGIEGLKQLVKSLLNSTIMLNEELLYVLNNLDTRNVNELNARIINAGVLNANLVQIKSELENGGYINLDGNGMTVNNGNHDTFNVNYEGEVTMTGALIRSSEAEFPRVEMNPATHYLGAFKTLDNFIQIYSPVNELSPVIRFRAGSVDSYLFYDPRDNSYTMTSNTAKINLSTLSDIELFGNSVYFSSWSAPKNYSTGRSLQQELNAKATSGSFTGSSGSANGGIPIGTQLMTAGGGSVTWQGIPAHSHMQS